MRSFAPLFLLCATLCLLGCRSGVDPATEKDLNAPVIPDGFDEKTLAELKCTANGSKLRLATKRELQKINDQLGNFQVRTFDGDLFTEMQTALLLRADGKVAYRFKGNVPNLKLGDALVLDKKK